MGDVEEVSCLVCGVVFCNDICVLNGYLLICEIDYLFLVVCMLIV